MIALTDVTARGSSRPRAQVGPLTLALAPGVSHALVGSAADGVELLLALIAGSTRTSRGSVTVFGQPAAPGKDVAYAPFLPELPEPLTVAGFLLLAARIRREPMRPPEERLSGLGCAGLARRRIAHLSPGEARAVALVEALTSRARLLLLSDPLTDMDPRVTSRVRGLLASRVADGATAVVTTASLADARALSTELHLFERGGLRGTVSADAPLPASVGPDGARLLVRSGDARSLLAELAADETFAEVHGHADAGTLVVVGSDPVAMAAAVAAASRRANVAIEQLSFLPSGGSGW